MWFPRYPGRTGGNGSVLPGCAKHPSRSALISTAVIKKADEGSDEEGFRSAEIKRKIFQESQTQNSNLKLNEVRESE